MDVEAQKPFACKVKDCGMSFTNEDHLTVHEKKHDMILNLGLTNKAAGAFIADQTPTPTRLIKNCEEVGLFDDLKHVNPFDETFRRAVELKNETPSIEMSVAESLNRSEDSLHTPQVFPQFDSAEPSTTMTISASSTDSSFHEFKVEKQRLILPENISDKQKKAPVKCKQRKPVDAHPKQANILPTLSSPVKPILVPAAINLVPATQIIAFSIPVTAVMQRPMLLPKLTPDPILAQMQPELSVKHKLKAHLSSPKVLSATTAPYTAPKIDEPPKKRFSTAKISNKHSMRDSREVDEDCMERRRAAALRYRRKIKKEQTDLKRKNAELVAENTQLKHLVKQLKEALWAHQNCPVTNSRGVQRSAVAIRDIVQPLLAANKETSHAATLQLPVATPLKFIVQNDSVNTDIGTIIKIPVE